MTKRVKHSILVLLVISILIPGCKAQNRQMPTHIDGLTEAVSPDYFGMHVHRLLINTPWPEVDFRNIRLWDTSTTWKNLEPRKGEWHFNDLDKLIDICEARHVRILLTFGKTPVWASSIAAGGSIDPETGAPLSMDDWRDFVQHVVSRYKGRIEAYEVWNEPNYKGFYNSDIGRMVEMTRIAADVIHRTDPSALVVSPSATTITGIPWMKTFLAQGGGKYVDVIGYHLYVSPDAPEKMITLAGDLKKTVQDAGIRKPIWNTESSWAKPKQFNSDEESEAYVMRALMLTKAMGIDRFYWYAWDNRTWSTLWMTQDDDNRMSHAAGAYEALQHWMLGKQISGCDRDNQGTWTCALQDKFEQELVYWNPDKSVRYNLPLGATPVACRSSFYDDLVSHQGRDPKTAEMLPKRQCFKINKGY